MAVSNCRKWSVNVSFMSSIIAGCAVELQRHDWVQEIIAVQVRHIPCTNLCPIPFDNFLEEQLVEQNKQCLVKCRFRDTKVKFSRTHYQVSGLADPIVQAVSPQVALSRRPGSRLPLPSTRPAVTFPAKSITAHWPVPNILLRYRGTWVWTTCPRLLLPGLKLVSTVSGVQHLSH